MSAAARSWLFVPGDDARKLARGLASGAEAVILDWEDAVALPNKVAARLVTTQTLAAAPSGGPRRWVRVNGADTADFEADLLALPVALIDGVVLPKARGPESLRELDARLTEVERRCGAEAGRLRVLAVATEDAASVLALSEFRGPVPRLAALMWGAEDLAADLGVRHNRDDSGRYRPPFRLARELTLMAAAAARVAAIDAVYTRVRDFDGLRAECTEAKADGFAGKALIHPDQLATIQAVFEPAAEELAWARSVVTLLDGQSGVAILDGQMIDRPHLRLARRLLGLSTD